MPPDNYLENPADWTDGQPLTPTPGHEGVPAPQPGLRPVGSEGPVQALTNVNFETGEGIAPEEPAKVPLEPGESVMSNRRFPNGALFNFAPANSAENPDMHVVFDANRMLVGFVRSESLAGFICIACTEHANRINEAFMKQAAADASPLVNKAGRPLKS